MKGRKNFTRNMICAVCLNAQAYNQPLNLKLDEKKQHGKHAIQMYDIFGELLVIVRISKESHTRVTH